ncbi:RNA polymerase sigma-70 factor [Chitinophaga pinensis]|uniref:RNA polymerase, sigma-24 subunit, ECF subfamily n=1 Tax=Chitinophaga pinensis (strain ATCC 43595 / DSM 2588 / LMG 13176 / NBRC 15968 / NCIMB 11800 / UQM 2034) TaxID=485918 RepID=A0A979GUR5_CHIPD|nr:RNA polymerase sigma-70 factor [Chitinophaga pinensis]ACU60919.1 RNA polymerase, sigma-24 subunit, ECF subfamily [Chitinophaga pinensis DSM 2588]
MDVVQDTDKLLLAALKKGDELAFSVLYDRYWAELYTMCYRRIGDEDAAKDIVQNIFVNLWTSRKEILIENTLAPYLNRAVRNRTISFYKKNMASMSRDAQFQHEQVQYAPDSSLDAKELEAVINDEIASMSDTMRKAFVLSRHENKSIREIATELSLSEQTIKNNISQALDRLRKKTQSFYAEPANILGVLIILLTKP